MKYQMLSSCNFHSQDDSESLLFLVSLFKHYYYYYYYIDFLMHGHLILLFRVTWVLLIVSSTVGRPPPSVIWMKDGVIIDDSFTTVNDRSLGFVVENELLMKHLSRSDIDSVLSCEAINSNLTSRTSATVSLDLSCKFLPLFTTKRMI